MNCFCFQMGRRGLSFDLTARNEQLDVLQEGRTKLGEVAGQFGFDFLANGLHENDDINGYPQGRTASRKRMGDDEVEGSSDEVAVSLCIATETRSGRGGM